MARSSEYAIHDEIQQAGRQAARKKGIEPRSTQEKEREKELETKEDDPNGESKSVEYSNAGKWQHQGDEKNKKERRRRRRRRRHHPWMIPSPDDCFEKNILNMDILSFLSQGGG